MDIKKKDRPRVARKYKKITKNYLTETIYLPVGIRRRFFKNRLGQAAAS